MSEADKKPWQHGYDLEDLKKIEAMYEHYNSYTLGPFAKYKKNNIAQDLHDSCLFVGGGIEAPTIFAHREVRSKVKTPITMYQNVVIGWKMPGDLNVSHVIGSKDTIRHTFHNCPNHTWTGVWAEDHSINNTLADLDHWKRVGSKITTFGEIYNIWFKDEGGPMGFREHPKVDPVEQIAVKHLALSLPWTTQQISLECEKAQMEFQDHYSNYNKKHSWSAISLRGYSTDPLMIEKPIEMSKDWKKTHEGWEDMFLTDTPLRMLFPKFNQFIAGHAIVGGDEIHNLHRVRFMKLKPGGGELSRHTDQVDPDSGLDIGKVARIHIPIYTNTGVVFSAWEPSGHRRDVHMMQGDVWVLDTRKPHMVVNKGTTDRIHLVIDVKVTPQCKALFL